MSALVGPGAFLLGAPVALAAGALSFASPCVLPLVPGYLGMVGGMDRAGAAGIRRLVTGAALFVVGFGLVFVLEGWVIGALGVLLKSEQDLIIRIAGAVVILMGLVFVGLVGPLQRVVKPAWQPRAGVVGAPVLGAVFAVGWTPCTSATLSVIVALALPGGSPVLGALLAAVYAIGLGLPFLVLAAGLGWATRVTALLRRHVRAVNLAGGGLLVAVGVLMVSGLWIAATEQLQVWTSGVTAL